MSEKMKAELIRLIVFIGAILAAIGAWATDLTPQEDAKQLNEYRANLIFYTDKAQSIIQSEIHYHPYDKMEAIRIAEQILDVNILVLPNRRYVKFVPNIKSVPRKEEH
jgi:hypothetical protein